MNTNEPQHPLDTSLTGHDDPLAVVANGDDVRGVVFVIPLDAPLPNELSTIAIPTGSLYKRLANLDGLPPGQEIGFVPLSGSELLGLDRSWKALVSATKVAVLTELPGAKYDLIFSQARRNIGLRAVDWPAVSDAIAGRLREVQRTRDTEPWRLKGVEEAPTVARPLRAPRRTDFNAAEKIIPLPEDDDEATP